MAYEELIKRYEADGGRLAKARAERRADAPLCRRTIHEFGGEGQQLHLGTRFASPPGQGSRTSPSGRSPRRRAGRRCGQGSTKAERQRTPRVVDMLTARLHHRRGGIRPGDLDGAMGVPADRPRRLDDHPGHADLDRATRGGQRRQPCRLHQGWLLSTAKGIAVCGCRKLAYSD